MASSNLKKTRTITDKLSLKGILSEDGTIVTYKNENKEDQTITIADCLDSFKGFYIDFSVTLKSEEDILDEV